MKVFFGVCFIILAIRFLLEGSFISAIVALFFALLLLRTYIALISARKQLPKKTLIDKSVPPVQTYTFQPTGPLHNCRFPDSHLSRQETISRSRRGDVVLLTKYEWEGEDAVAVINRRLGYDVGVVPADQVGVVVNLMDSYDVSGEIVNIDTFEYRGETKKHCDVTLKCYSKSTSHVN